MWAAVACQTGIATDAPKSRADPVSADPRRPRAVAAAKRLFPIPFLLLKPRAMSEKTDYKDTVFLPKTDFPMKAGLAAKEPAILARWAEAGLYEQLRKARAG